MMVHMNLSSTMLMARALVSKDAKELAMILMNDCPTENLVAELVMCVILALLPSYYISLCTFALVFRELIDRAANATDDSSINTRVMRLRFQHVLGLGTSAINQHTPHPYITTTGRVITLFLSVQRLLEDLALNTRNAHVPFFAPHVGMEGFFMRVMGLPSFMSTTTVAMKVIQGVTSILCDELVVGVTPKDISLILLQGPNGIVCMTLCFFCVHA